MIPIADIHLIASNTRGQQNELASKHLIFERLEDSANLQPPDVIAAEIDSQISFAHPSGLIRSLPLTQPAGLPVYPAASHHAVFPSMSSAPAISIVEDLQAALAQFAEIANDLKR